MSKWAKFYDKLEGGNSDNNIEFDDLVNYLERLGWVRRNAGTSHMLYEHALVPPALNLQPRSDGKAKAYQVKQVREALDEYTGDDRDGWLRG